MRVMPERQAEVADVLGLINGLHHGTHDQRLDEGTLLGVPESVGDRAEVPGLHVLRQLRRHAERVQRLEQHVELFLFGFAVHTIQRAHAALLELVRHRHVGEDHALLDELVSLVAFVHVDALDAAGGVEVELGLGRVELERAAFMTCLLQRAIHIEQRQ